MNAFLDLLKFIFLGLLTIIIAVIIVCWLFASMETLHYTKENNILLKELCVENGINVDSVLNTSAKANDEINVNVKIGE